MLLVEGESLLDSLVREDVAVGKVFCEDAASGLVLLCEIFGRVTLGVTSGLARSNLLKVGRGGDVDLVGAELSVVEEESGLSGSLFFEAHGVRLGGLILGVRGDGKVGNLATDGSVSKRAKIRDISLMSYQKLKKSLTSFSVVSWLMPLTLTVLDIFAVCLEVDELVICCGFKIEWSIERVG